MSTVLVAGSSGLIGSALTTSLRGDGHDVRRLVRRPTARADEVEWHPDVPDLPATALTGVDAVVCLTGVPLQPRPPTRAYKDRLYTSRIGPVGTLATAIAASDHRPTFIAASAVGYYGDKGEAVVDESAPPGTDYFAQLCVKWEAAADPAREAGARVVSLRTGIVLARDGGLIKTLRPLARVGLAGPQGSGRQFLSWVTLTDEVAAIRFLLDSDISGPVNVTTPNAARNREIVAAVAHAMHRPAVMRVPAFVLRPVLRDFADALLGGARVLPGALSQAGFEFRCPELEPAVRAVLG
jgi:uncharacterized protein (TIGR01777 family)